MRGIWTVEQDEHTWQLFFTADGMMMPLQIIKAPKKGTPYAEYWPSAQETKFILDALNAQSSDE